MAKRFRVKITATVEATVEVTDAGTLAQAKASAIKRARAGQITSWTIGNKGSIKIEKADQISNAISDRELTAIPL